MSDLKNWCVSEVIARVAAANYKPNPEAELLGVEIPDELHSAVDAIEGLVHNTWAAGRMAQGWTWGPARDDANKKHPDLIPSCCLSDEERAFNRDTAAATVRKLLAMGFKITRA